MKKIALILLLAGFISSYSQITIKTDLPAATKVGESFITNVTIKKGNLDNFAKYQMDVPLGYTITTLDTKGGNFTFENQRAKIVWVSMPSDPEFSIKLKVQATSTSPTQGTFTQKFFYLESDQKKEVEAAPVVIRIGDAPLETKLPETKTVEQAVAVKTEIVTPAPESDIFYKIQLGKYATQPSKNKFAGLTDLNIVLVDGMYLVTVGNFKIKEDAVKYRDEIKTKGFNGFLVKYKNGQRIIN